MFLTPDAAPTGYRWVQFAVPQGPFWQPIVRGALCALFDPANFEQYGSLTPDETAEQFREFMFNWMTLLDISEGGSLVVGEVYWFAGASVPGDSLLCDGTLYQISEYPALYAAVGTVYGGDGVDTFGVPDVAGRMPVGVGSGSGLTPRSLADVGGEETHVLTTGELPAHAHSINHNHAGNRSFVTFAQGSSAGADLLRTTAGTAGVTAAHSGNSGDSGSGDAHENMPPFLALLPCIRAF